MPTATALDLITAALVELNVVAAGETVHSSDAILGLASLNRLIDEWKTENLLVYTETRTTFSIVSGTQDYTVGTGGTVNVTRPVSIRAISIVDTSVTIPLEVPLTPLTDTGWENVALKTMTAFWPTYYFYNPTFPLGTITYWPIPTSTTLLGVLYGGTTVVEMATLVTAFSLPPGYQRMIVKNLAADMCPSYSRQPDPLLMQQAMQSKGNVKRGNYRLRDMSVELGALVQGVGGIAGYNIRTDGGRR